MAQGDNDNYKEGVDFEYVQGNGDDNSNFKTRRFFTKAEKAKMKAPKAAAPKAAAPKKAAPNLKGITTEKITVRALDPAVRPAGKASGMPMDSKNKAIKNYTDQLNSGKLSDSEARSARTAITRLGGTYKTDALRAQAAAQKEISSLNQGMKELFTGRKGAAAQYKEGGSIKMKEGGSTGTRKKPMSDEQKYRPANARNMDMEKLGKAKIRTAKNIDDSLKAGKKSTSYGKNFSEDSTAYGLRSEGSRMLGTSYGRSIGDDTTGKYKKGGMIKEGTAKDMREDKAMAKKSGMTMKQHEASAADKKHDAPKKMAMGGAVKKATGGSMRGTGCAVRGKGYSGSY
jgi:hypothetical protein